jgi:glucosamine-6-phosphate deaminase
MKLMEMLGIPAGGLERHTAIPIHIARDTDGLYQHIARHMADTVIANNREDKKTAFILPVGPTRQYPVFAQMVNRERIDCRNLYTFNMDEYLDWQGRPIPETHPMSFKTSMRAMLWDRMDAALRPPENHRFFPHPWRPEEMDQGFDLHGPADVCYAGVGYHGHVAFNEGVVSRWFTVPEEEFLNARTHIVAMADDTFVINSVREAGGNCEMIPPFAVTIGMKDIMASRQIMGLFYCGEWQRTVFRRTLFQEPTVEYPGTFLKRHPRFSVAIDINTAAAPEIAPF